MTYLDYAATAPLLPEAKAAMTEVMDDLSRAKIGNPAALHTPGQRGKQIIESAREAVAALIGAAPDEIIFTSGGSESNNTVANLFAGQKIAVSAIEHPSMLEAARARAGKLAIIPVDKFGFVDAASVPRDANLISVMLANNELGTIEPVAQIAEQFGSSSSSRQPGHSDSHAPAGQKRPFLHTDATQAVGKIPVDVHALGVDFLTLSAHKIGGPVGIGALYISSRAKSHFRLPSRFACAKKSSEEYYHPLILGGHQENGYRAGTSNAMLAAGFGTAAAAAKLHLPDYAKIKALRDELSRRILAEIPYSSINNPSENVLPNILNVSFQAAEGESIQLYLDAEGIAVSTGSACASGDTSPSHVIMATKNDAEVAHSSIRFSFGLANTSDDIKHVMSVLPGIITRLQGISTVKIKEQPHVKN